MKTKILVVDDDKYMRDFISAVLDKGDYQVKLASNGKDAVDIVVKQDIDLMITDIYMDGMDGIKTIEMIKEIKPKIPIIVMTSDENIETEREARDKGVVAYFIKPIEKERLKAVVESVIKRRRESCQKY